MNSTGSTTTSTKSNSNQYVKLNVGGHFFQTTVGTLMSQEGKLNNMFKGDFEDKKDSDGFVMIDRDGETFSEILNFLRRGSISLARPKKELENILAEAEFYQIDPLIITLREKLSSLQERELILQNSPKCHLVVDGTSLDVIKQSSKPMFYLIIGKNFRDPCNYQYPQARQLSDELRVFGDLCRKYNDIFEFLIVLDENRSDKFWLIISPGMEDIKVDSLASYLATENPITKLLAHLLRNTNASNPVQN